MKKLVFSKIIICLIFIVFTVSLSACNSTKECNHEWQNATCTTKKTCTKCGKQEGFTLIHDYKGNCEDFGICTMCGIQSTYKINHSYKGKCGEFGVCSKCEKISTVMIEHSMKGNVRTGTLTCISCNKSMTKEDIRNKSTNQLTDIDRAYIYWHLNYYLTATTSSGAYKYSINEAFQIVHNMFYFPVSYLKDDFWGTNSIYNHNCYSKYYYK